MMNKLMLIALLATTACGKGSAASNDPAAMCNQMWERGIKVLRFPKLEAKPRYLEKCVTQPVAFLRCRSSGDMTEACTLELKANREGMIELSRILTGG